MKVPLFRWIDRILGPLLIVPVWLFSSLFPKARLEPKRILVLKLWAMGESILTLPLIHAIKKKYPKATITVLARDRVRAVYTGIKDIADVKSAEFFSLFTLLPLLRRYDLAIDCEPYLNMSALLAWWLAKRRIGFSHGIRNLLYTDKIAFDDQKHEALAYMDMAKPLSIEEQPRQLIPVTTSRADEKKVDGLFKEWGIKKSDTIVCICPGAAESSRGRIWDPKKFAKVADALVKEFLAKIILIGSKGERPLAEEVSRAMEYGVINAAGETNVKELAVLLERCALTISNDTGPMHLSAAMGTPTLGLFCPNTPVRFAPYGPGNAFVYKPVLSKPCINVHKGQVPDCTGHKHMSLVTVADVLEKARRMLYARKH